MERWQRTLLVTLGTLVVVMAVIAVALVVRNALGSSGITGETPAVQTTTTDAAPTTETSPAATRPEQPGTTAITVPPTTGPTITLPPATLPEEPIQAVDLRLQPEGLGPLAFGTGTTRTLMVLREALGAPDSDSGWLPADIDDLRCPGTRARIAIWGSLAVYFSDGPTEWGADGHEHFFSFAYTLAEGATSPDGPSLQTSEGLQLGATLSRASGVYGEASITLDHPSLGTILEVDVPGPGYLLGTFSGPEPDNVLTSLSGGTGCEN